MRPDGATQPSGAPSETSECTTDGAVDRLSRALEAAALASQWATVSRLAALLKGMKDDAQGADVIDLDARRKGGKP